MVFQLTIRAASCKEVADDPEAVKKVTKLYWDAEKGSTPTSVLLPWFPSAARKRKLKATQDLFMLFKQHVDDRKATGRVEEDPMQSLIDAGDGANDIVTVSNCSLLRVTLHGFYGASLTTTIIIHLVRYGCIIRWHQCVFCYMLDHFID